MNEINPTPEFEEQVRKAVAVPNASPEFVNQLRNKLTKGPEKMRSQTMFKPAWAVSFVLALAVMVAGIPGVAAAIGRLFGYVPEVGLVENTGSLRILAEPASLMRDGVTLLVKNVIVYEDRVEVSYEVEGLAPFNDATRAEDAGSNPTAFCGGMNLGDAPNTDGDARLRLPDGTLLERDTTGLYPQNAFAMTPVYKAVVPAEVTELTLVLKCLPWARRGVVPENWEVPLKLKSVPADEVVGVPVIEVAQPTVAQPVDEPPASAPTEAPALPAPIVSLALEKLVPMQSWMVFYFRLNVENPDPALISVMPSSVHVIDSQGQKIQLIGNFAWQPFEHRVGSLFEYTSQTQPAAGPLTLVVENAEAYYAPMYVEPKQATPEEMSFTFDVGSNPQQGQTWELDREILIAGYPVRITSARAVNWEDVKEPSFIDGSQGYEYGYQFNVESDPSVKLDVEMDIMQDNCGFAIKTDYRPVSSSLLYSQLCRDAYPSGQVKVTIWQLAVLLEDTWQVTWTP